MADSITPALDQYLNPPTSAPQAPTEPAPQEQNIPDQPVNVINPTGKLVSVPQSQINSMNLFNNGYTPASPEDIRQAQLQKSYGDIPHQIGSAIKGFESVATLGTLPYLVNKIAPLIGENPEEANAEAEKTSEANPISNTIGSLAGMFTAPLTGAESAVLGAAAPLGAKIAPFLPQVVQKVGSYAVKGAVNNALYQSTQDIDKAFSEGANPAEAVQMALLNVPTSALYGGIGGVVFGTVPALWQATSNSKLGKFLGAITDKFGGVEGAGPSQAIDEALASSNIKPTPEIQAALNDMPSAKADLELLRNSSTASGDQVREALSNFKSQANESMINALGKTPEDVSAIKETFSPYETGKNLGNTLADEFQQQVGPLSEQFESLKNKYANVPLPESAIGKMTEDIGKLAQDQGWNTSPSSDISKEVNRVLKELPLQTTLKDLSSYQTQIGNNTYDFTNPQLSRAGQMMKGIINKVQGDLITDSLGAQAPELLEQHAAAKAAWAQANNLKDALDSRLHVGGGSSPTSFIKNLKEMAQTDGEKVLNRLSGKGNADILNTLSENFPQTAQALKDYHVDNLLKTAASAGTKAPTDIISAKTLLNGIQKMSPELRSFAIPDESLARINSVKTLMDSLPANANPSGTAGMADKLHKYGLSSAVGLVTGLASHSPIAGAVLGGLTKLLSKDAPDAARLAMLRFLGSSEPLNPGAFKSMFDYVNHTIKGESLLSKAANGVFKTGTVGIAQALQPSDKVKSKLNSQLADLQNDPSPLFKVGGDIGHYLPDHQTALAQTAATVSNYLNSIRPTTPKLSPLDPDIEPTKAQQSKYDNALAIAENPLTVLQKVKDGELTSEDVTHLDAMYPELHQKMNQKLMAEMTDSLSKENDIPYSLRRSLSLMTGQNLDSSMAPASIQANQATFQPGAPTPSNQSGQRQQPRTHKTPLTALKKISSLDSTPLQARSQSRQES